MKHVVLGCVACVVILLVVAWFMQAPIITQRQTPKDEAQEERLPTVDKSATAQNKRQETIQKLCDVGVFSKVELGESPRVWVTARFHDMTYEDRNDIIGVVYAYCCEADTFADSVRLFDSRTNEEVGRYSRNDNGLKMY